MNEGALTAQAARVRQWAAWFGILIVVGTMMLSVRSRLDKAHVALSFLLIVLGGSAAGGRVLGLSLAAAAFLVFDTLFLKPYNSLVIADPLDWLVLLAFLVTSIVAAQLLERLRRQAVIAEQRADEIDRIASLGAETLNAARAEDALDAIANVICAAMGTERCAIVLRQEDGELRLAGSSSATDDDESSTGLLTYTVTHAEAAAERDDGTLTLIGDALSMSPDRPTHRPPLSGLRALGIPLRVRDRIVGALWLSGSRPFTLVDDQRRLLGALSYYAALGAERVRLAKTADEADALRRADRLKDALLASVSHDLRTPLTAIKGIANEVWRGGDPERAHVIEEEADRLNVLVDDLLELSQLNAGSLRLTTTVNTADDVIGAALERVEAAHGRTIEVHIANEGGILAGAFDFAHTMRALTNLMENALKYSPRDSTVMLRASRHETRLRFVIEDRGAGVHRDDEARIFEPFYRGRGIPDGVRGTGLGLAIARQLTEAQRGTLAYEPCPGGGSRFTLELPLAIAPPD